MRTHRASHAGARAAVTVTAVLAAWAAGITVGVAVASDGFSAWPHLASAAVIVAAVWAILKQP